MDLLILAPASWSGIDIYNGTAEIIERIHIILDQLNICMVA